MIRPRHLTVLLAALSTLCVATPRLLAQGALTPPSAPGPTLKTINQVEPRTPLGTPGQVATSTLTIDEPGSYVLMGPITVGEIDGIVIASSDVTLDLNGFTIRSTATSAQNCGIRTSSDTVNISIHNGFIHGDYAVDSSTGAGAGAGFHRGILSFSTNNIRVADVAVQGVRLYGIFLDSGRNTIISHCQASHIGNSGLEASIVESSSVNECANGSAIGIAAMVIRDCTVNARHVVTALRGNASVTGSRGIGKLVGISGGSVTNSLGGGRKGIVASTSVSHSRGLGGDTGSGTQVTGDYIGIDCPTGTVSFSQGKTGSQSPAGTHRSIVAAIAIACTIDTEYGPSGPIVAPQKHLGTP